MKISKKRLLLVLVFLLNLTCLPMQHAKATASETTQVTAHTPIVNYLIYLVNSDEKLNSVIVKSLTTQNKKSFFYKISLNKFYSFFDGWLTENLTPKNLMVSHQEIFFHFISDAPILRSSSAFMGWLGQFFDARANYLRSKASTEKLSLWLNDPEIHINDFVVPKNGFNSFDQFFLRKLKPGARPISDANDPSIIVSPADCLLDQPITISPMLTPARIPGKTIYIKDIMNNNKLANLFNGGMAALCHLALLNYHHIHAPVSGKIVSLESIGGIYYFDKHLDHPYEDTRAYIIIKTEDCGYVAMIPIGQWTVNSIVLNYSEGESIKKGEDIGHFNFGGSAILLLFQKDKCILDKSLLSMKQKKIGQNKGIELKVGARIGKCGG